MRTVRRNKQRLMYALYKGKAIAQLVKDRDGNPMLDENGDYIYDDSSTSDILYDDPVPFFGNIAFSKGSGEAESVAYGISLADYDSTLIMNVGEIPIDETSLIFKDSIPEYDSNGNLKRDSADFSVVKVQPSLNTVMYLLKRIVKNA
jgi:hypothetical protein